MVCLSAGKSGLSAASCAQHFLIKVATCKRGRFSLQLAIKRSRNCEKLPLPRPRHRRSRVSTENHLLFSLLPLFLKQRGKERDIYIYKLHKKVLLYFIIARHHVYTIITRKDIRIARNVYCTARRFDRSSYYYRSVKRVLPGRTTIDCFARRKVSIQGCEIYMVILS